MPQQKTQKRRLEAIKPLSGGVTNNVFLSLISQFTFIFILTYHQITLIFKFPPQEITIIL